MLLQEVTPEMIRAWKETSDQYRPRLRPDKKTGPELIAYLIGKYPVTVLADDRAKQVVADNVILNRCLADKLPAGKAPDPVVFSLENTGTGKQFYENQDELFRGTPILVGVERETSWFLVEGSSLLWDELFAYRGLDEDDLTNYYLVAEYISCLKRFGWLDNVLVR
jgi:hypothetical protein